MPDRGHWREYVQWAMSRKIQQNNTELWEVKTCYDLNEGGWNSSKADGRNRKTEKPRGKETKNILIV
jgi:hypothetical protein